MAVSRSVSACYCWGGRMLIVPFLPCFSLEASTWLSDNPFASVAPKWASTSRGERTYAFSILLACYPQAWGVACM
jgi:hypothetical protein